MEYPIINERDGKSGFKFYPKTLPKNEFLQWTYWASMSSMEMLLGCVEIE